MSTQNTKLPEVPQANPTWMRWTGIVMTAIPALMLTMSAIMKFVQPAPFVEGFAKFGWPISLAIPIGIVEVIATVLYVIPRTSVLGAILLTGYLGGAIATHVRAGDGFVPVVLIGIVVWLGLFFRDPRLRQLIPIKR